MEARVDGGTCEWRHVWMEARVMNGGTCGMEARVNGGTCEWRAVQRSDSWPSPLTLHRRSVSLHPLVTTRLTCIPLVRVCGPSARVHCTCTCTCMCATRTGRLYVCLCVIPLHVHVHPWCVCRVL